MRTVASISFASVSTNQADVRDRRNLLKNLKGWVASSLDVISQVSVTIHLYPLFPLGILVDEGHCGSLCLVQEHKKIKGGS